MWMPVSHSLHARSQSGESEASQVQRTSCGIELCLELDFDERPALFVRGWVFDRGAPTQNLRLSIASGTVGAVVYPIDRAGGGGIARRSRHSLESCFTALIYPETIDTKVSSLSFAYELPSGEVVQGGMKLPQPWCAVERVNIKSEIRPDVRLESEAVVVMPLHTTPDPALSHAVMRELALADVSTTCICSPAVSDQVMHAMGPYQLKGPPILIQSYAALAKLLRRDRRAYKIVVFAHPWESVLHEIVLPTLLASAHTPRMLLLHPGESLDIPPSFGGGLLDIVRWPSTDFSARLRSSLLRALR